LDWERVGFICGRRSGLVRIEQRRDTNYLSDYRSGGGIARAWPREHLDGGADSA
jgi:hypothetical protein